MAEDVTLGEVARRLDAMHVDLREMRREVVNHDDLKAVATAWHLALETTEQRLSQRLDEHDKRIARFESWETWGIRAVGLVLLAAVLSLVVRTSM
ncbi:MAG: hypothetical protein ACOYY2_12995 [Actinomycetota bacterium]